MTAGQHHGGLGSRARDSRELEPLLSEHPMAPAAQQPQRLPGTALAPASCARCSPAPVYSLGGRTAEAQAGARPCPAGSTEQSLLPFPGQAKHAARLRVTAKGRQGAVLSTPINNPCPSLVGGGGLARRFLQLLGDWSLLQHWALAVRVGLSPSLGLWAAFSPCFGPHNILRSLTPSFPHQPIPCQGREPLLSLPRTCSEQHQYSFGEFPPLHMLGPSAPMPAAGGMVPYGQPRGNSPAAPGSRQPRTVLAWDIPGLAGPPQDLVDGFAGERTCKK